MIRRLLPLVLLSCHVDATSPGAATPGGGPRPAPAVGTLDLWVDPLWSGESTTFVATGAAPGQTVSFALSTTGLGTGPCPGGLCLDLLQPVLLGTAVADSAGTASLSRTVPAGASGTAAVQAHALGPQGLTAPLVLDVLPRSADHAALVAGVQTLELGGSVPSRIALWQPQAFPVVADATGGAIVAAARVNAGKVWLAGHEGAFLGGGLTGGGDADQLLRNALDWMDGATLAIAPGLGALSSWLSAEGRPHTIVSSPSQLPPGATWISTTYIDLPPTEDAALRTHLAEGGGWIAAGHAWWWATSHDGLAAVDYPGNHPLTEAGLFVTSATLPSGTWSVSAAPPPDLLHPVRGAQALAGHVLGTSPLSLGERGTAASALRDTLVHLPLDWMGDLDGLGELAAATGPVVPTAASPVDPDQSPEASVVITRDHLFASQAPATQILAHPAATDFPGAVPPGSPRVDTVVALDATHDGVDGRYAYSNPSAPAWVSTGLYAPPGEVLTVEVPSSVAGLGLSARIGVHTDTLWHKDTWQRFPEITRSWPLDAPTTPIASAFGGPVVLEVPPGMSLGPVQVTVRQGVPMADFTLGSTSPLQWITTELTKPAPWATLQGERFAMHVPLADAATVTDPVALTTLWDDVLAVQEELTGDPLPRPRLERAVVDRQISAGWMHSGHPFMAHLASATELVDLTTLQTQGAWGPFHELGHNHQWLPTVLPGTTETTVNLFTLYALEEVVGLPPRTGHPALEPATRAQRMADHLAAGAPFEDWSVWVALETYLQLQEAFGWALFIDTFGLYTLDAPGTDPVTEQERIDLWVLRVSQTAGVDLGPFHTAWGLPVSPATLAQTALLPPWLGDPMNP